MKKILLMAAFAVLLAACESKLKPEYATLPEITNVQAVTDNVQAFQSVPVSAEVSCKFGVYSAMLYYWTGNDPKRGKFVEGKIYENNPDKVSYSGMLPGAKAGTKMSFQVVAYSPYDVEGVTEIFTYEVKGTGEEQPVE